MATTRKTGRVVLCTAFILFALFAIASAKISRGNLKTKDNFVLLSRFAVSTAGKGMVLFESSDMKPGQDAEDNKMFLSFYNDEKKEDWYWKNVDNDKQTEKACIDKLNDQHYENVEAHVNGSSWEFPITNKHTPHSWWIAVSDCAKSSNENFEMWYDVHWVNAGSSWYREFSLEDQDLLTIYVIFFIFWFLILPGFFYAFIKKIAIQKQKPSLEFQLLLTGMIITFFALLFYLIHYSVYASDGRGVRWLLGIAESLDMIQTVVLMTLIYLFLRGKRERTFVDLGVIGFLLLMYFSFFWWQLPDSIVESIDEKYKWQTAPGITMLCFRFLLFCYLAFLIALKIKNESNLYRRIVLVVLLLAATFYFLTLPFTVILMSGASFFYRWKTVLAVSLSIDMITYIFFGLILVESPLAKLLNPISIRPYDPLIKDDDDSNNPYGSL